MKRILYAAAECGPFIKTGGLGSVLASLPRELDKDQYDVRVVIPGYECIDQSWKDQMEYVLTFHMMLGWREQTAVLKKMVHEGVVIYFIENPYYFCGDSPYGDISADVEKFTFFCKAALEMLAYLKFEPDIIHCHDWQSAMIPVFLKGMFSHDPFYSRIKTIMTIHNLKFQGWSDMGRMKDITGLPDEMFGFDCLESFGQANMLKGGLSCADKITTVSKTYAEEIKEPEYGENLDPVLRYRAGDLSGIVNGIDYKVYNPAKDPALKVRYGVKSFASARPANKAELQRRTGLPEGEEYFTLGIVSRLTDQKGFDLFSDIMKEMFDMPVQLYVLGGGQKEYEQLFRKAAEDYPDRVYLQTAYTDEMAKVIYGGCDAVLMPSRFEPCGLCQLMSLRYGAVPVVRETGGLKDTVAVFGESDKPTGFGFTDYQGSAFASAISQAYRVFTEDKELWNEIIARGMRKNYSWKSSCRKYERIYDKLMQ